MLWLSLLHSFIQLSLNSACGVSQIRDGADLWQCSRLEIRLITLRRSTIPHKQFIIIIIIITHPYNRTLTKLRFNKSFYQHSSFFSIWVFFHEYSRITGLQGQEEGISLTPHYQFHPLHRHLDISWAITTETSPLHIASSRTRAGKL